VIITTAHCCDQVSWLLGVSAICLWHLLRPVSWHPHMFLRSCQQTDKACGRSFSLGWGC